MYNDFSTFASYYTKKMNTTTKGNNQMANYKYDFCSTDFYSIPLRW